MGIILAVQTAFPLECRSISAAAEEASVDYCGIVSAVLEYSADSRGSEGFWDGLEFGQSDWLALCASKLYGSDGADKYIKSVKTRSEELMSSEGFVAPTELQRAAVVLSAFGECSRELIDAAAYNNVELDRQGFNAWIWALIAANCSGTEADSGSANTRRSLAEHILSAQLPDGGFALRGESADCDITAAAIYALAPLSDNSDISAALERAVARLSELQLDSGGFASMGTENCESSAQAVMAFAATGLDESDARVSRAIEAILKYKREDGGFAHLPDGSSNGLASAQAAEAFTALQLLSRGEQLFAPIRSSNANAVETTDANGSGDADGSAGSIANVLEASIESDAELFLSSQQSTRSMSGLHIKLIISAALALTAAALLIAGLAGRKKSLLALAAVSILAAGAVWLLDIRTPEEYYAQTESGSLTVTVSADCRTALENMDDIVESINPISVIPEDGIVIAQCEVALNEGATAFDALTAAARNQRVSVDYVGSVYGVYVNGIGYIYEFGFGEMSGWIYRVNGELPNISAGKYELQEGDFVEFVYTCDMGRDLEE